MEMDKKDFERLLRKSAFHGFVSVLVVIVVVGFLAEFLGGVAKGMGINELWKWVLVIPFGLWFIKFMEDK